MAKSIKFELGKSEQIRILSEQLFFVYIMNQLAADSLDTREIGFLV